MDRISTGLKHTFDYEKIIKTAAALVVAGTIALGSCDKPGNEPGDNGGDGGDGGGGGKTPITLKEDKRSNSYVEGIISNYLHNVCVKQHKHETEQELIDCAVAFTNKTLYIGKEDSIKSDKLAFISASVGKRYNYDTFDYTQAMVKVTTGNGGKRAGMPEITIPYNPSERSFRYDYEIKNVEKEN